MPSFKIPVIPPTTNKTIRFPEDVVKNVERVIAGTSCTFTAFIIAAVRSAVEQIETTENKK